MSDIGYWKTKPEAQKHDAAADYLGLLPPTNRIVASHLKKIGKGGRLSPVLLVRGNMRAPAALTVADGYHRICASYELNENTEIPCRIVDL